MTLKKNEFLADWMENNSIDIPAALEAWAEYRGETGSGFKADFFAELEKGAMTVEAMDIFLSDKSENVIKNRANWNGIRGMANRIWEAK